MYHSSFRVFVILLLLFAFVAQAAVQTVVVDDFLSVDTSSVDTSNADPLATADLIVASDKTAGDTQTVLASVKLNNDLAHTKELDTERPEHEKTDNEQHSDCCDGNCEPSCNVDCSDGSCICAGSMCSAPLYLTAFIGSPAPVFLTNPIYSYQFTHTYFISNSLYRPPISAA
ncbi:hypothetical protein [Thalassotalea euphylliae]|uniref:Uncharacterized protein n=1 Tax=Thalassotalea euphylliae TaxID=1655234 RepID=A0A3E0TZD1_9GAMM|nr:hypothetical protein [Thalassotalea euphylliae]REL30016.1 hypothetical protein DXX94_04455 [Thalassotalea euphylliae]